MLPSQAAGNPSNTISLRPISSNGKITKLNQPVCGGRCDSTHPSAHCFPWSPTKGSLRRVAAAGGQRARVVGGVSFSWLICLWLGVTNWDVGHVLQKNLDILSGCVFIGELQELGFPHDELGTIKVRLQNPSTEISHERKNQDLGQPLARAEECRECYLQEYTDAWGRSAPAWWLLRREWP